MAINDILSGMLEKIGLKKSEATISREEILRLEEEIKCIHDTLGDLEDESKLSEKRLRDAKAQYDAASGAMKKSREALVRSRMREFQHIQERQQVTLSRLDATQALLQQRRLELEQLLHPVETDALEEASDIKKEILEDLHERDEALGNLEENTYQISDAKGVDGVPTSQKEAEDAARLEREFAELMGTEPRKNTEDAPQKPEEKKEGELA